MIAILGEDTVLTKMLQLEAKRGGFSVTESPESASVWLLDLAHPPRPLPKKPQGTLVIGFAENGKRGDTTDLIFPLPYPTEELQDVLRHCASESTPTGEIKLLPRLALVGKRQVRLSPAEERLLSLLLKNRGNTVPEAELLLALDESTADSNVLQVHLCRLRQKLAGEGPSLIRAVRGVGYRLAL